MFPKISFFFSKLNVKLLITVDHDWKDVDQSEQKSGVDANGELIFLQSPNAGRTKTHKGSNDKNSSKTRSVRSLK